MATQGPKTASSVANDTSRAGTNDNWTNPGNAATSDDSRATCTNTGTGASEYLVWTNFGFTIPSGATINGVEASIERNRNVGSTSVKDALLYLVKGGAIQTGATNKADTSTNWTGVDSSVNYGGAADLWGVTLAHSDVNSTGFGVALAVDLVDGGSSAVASVDSATLTVTYTGGGSSSRVSIERLKSKLAGKVR